MIVHVGSQKLTETVQILRRLSGLNSANPRMHSEVTAANRISNELSKMVEEAEKASGETRVGRAFLGNSETWDKVPGPNPDGAPVRVLNDKMLADVARRLIGELDDDVARMMKQDKGKFFLNLTMSEA